MSALPTRRYHHGNLRAELLERAVRTVSEHGVGELSLRELARDVGVSHAAPRRHFPDRQALLDALAEEGFNRLDAALRGAADAAGEGPDARIRALGRAYVTFTSEHAALVELMFAGKHRPGATRIQEAAERTFATPLAVIAQAQAAGELIPGDPVGLATVTFATLHGLASMANGGMLDVARLDAIVEDAVDRLLHGLHPRASA